VYVKLITLGFSLSAKDRTFRPVMQNKNRQWSKSGLVFIDGFQNLAYGHSSTALGL
jgi:hypothetical protein